jgi:hypothetical protein
MNDAAGIIKGFISGVIVIGLVTTIGLRSDALAKVIRSGGQAMQGLTSAVERG